MYVCMYACMHACMHVCMYGHVCMCIYICVYVCIYICNMYIYIYMYMCIYIYICICVYIYIYAQDAWFAVGGKANFLQVSQGTLVSLKHSAGVIRTVPVEQACRYSFIAVSTIFSPAWRWSAAAAKTCALAALFFFLWRPKAFCLLMVFPPWKHDKRKIESLFNGKGPLATQHVCYSPPWACEKSKGFRQDYHWHALKNGKILIRYQLLTQPDQILGWYYPCRCQTRS